MAFVDIIERHKVIAIVREIERQYMKDLMNALYAGGIRMVECTFNQKEPNTWGETINSINCINKNAPDDLLVGAGTVLSIDQLHMAMDAGASFYVSPNLNINVLNEAKRLAIGTLPGVMTSTEMVNAYDAGADAVKLFPAGNMGVGYLKAIRAPLSHIPVVVVGGIDANNAADYISAGAIGAGVGGHLAKRELITTEQFDVIEQEARKLLNAVNSVKEK